MPKYEPTDDQREMVTVLIAARWTHADIAENLNISVDVLEENFPVELACGRIKIHAEMVLSLYKSALAGNVQALKICLLLNN